MILRVFIILVLVVGCGRPLTETERAFATQLHGDQLNLNRVRLVHGAPVAAVTFRRKARPRVTCRERILPPVREAIVTAKPAAVTIFHSVFFARDWYAPNFMPRFPDKLFLAEAMLLGHELTHVWQWQNRKRTGYSPLRAAAEHSKSSDPYLFDLSDTPDFLDYGYEQQGAIVEEYICCRTLAPKAARTQRLHEMLRGAFPVSNLPGSRPDGTEVILPWRGAELNGICA
ncbi:MAG: hypothetical protein AB8B51_04050 [Sedimentitalea sp.]